MITRIARPYAKALLEVTPDDRHAQAARESLHRFATAMELVPAIGAMASNPAIPLEVKRRVVDEIATYLETDEHAKNLLRLLTDNYRLPQVPSIVEALDELVDRRLGIANVVVTTPEPLSEEARGRLETALAQTLGRQIRLETRLDRSLIGGLILQVGSVRYDGSLSGQLERLSRQLASAA